MPRAGLSRAAVVGLGLEVVDTAGFAGLTLAAVAARAGVAVPSLYKHVEGLADLRREVALVAVRELTGELRAAVGPDRAGALTRTATALREYARRAPGRYEATQAAPHLGAPADGPLAAASAEAVAATVDALRPLVGALEGHVLVDTVRTVRAAVHGFVHLELTGGFGMPDDVDVSFAHLVAVLDAGLATVARSEPGERP